MLKQPRHRYLTPPAIAKRLKVRPNHPATVRKWCEQSVYKTAERVNGCWYVLENDPALPWNATEAPGTDQTRLDQIADLAGKIVEVCSTDNERQEART